MAIRLVTLADAPTLQQHLETFFGQPVPLARVQRFLTNPDVVAYVDTTRRTFCALQRRGDDIQVAGLFPRGATRARLKPVLKAALQGVLSRFPQTATWRVWAKFEMGAVDASGTPDGGRGEC